MVTPAHVWEGLAKPLSPILCAPSVLPLLLLPVALLTGEDSLLPWVCSHVVPRGGGGSWPP